MKQITVLGIGNILLSDEGFGVRVIEELSRRFRFSDNVQILDGGTLGLDLLPFITGTEKLLVVDAIAGGGAPGTFYRFEGEEVKAYLAEKVSLHELGIRDVLAVLEMQEQPVREIVVLGVEPASLELGLELTAATLAAVDATITAIIADLDRWQVEVIAND